VTEDSVTEVFVRLFRGRGDARGSWSGPAVREPLTPAHFERHLRSPDEDDWFGVYNVIGSMCSWGCIDIDTDDYALALNLRNAMHAKGVPGWVEQTARGYHVWVFPFDGLVSASTMRRALRAVCAAVDYRPKEIFPKQDQVRAPGLGNFVRLPFNGLLANPRTHTPRLMAGWPLRACEGALRGFLTDMDKARVLTSTLEDLAALVPCPQPVDISVDFQAGVEVEEIVGQLSALARHIWYHGPLQGNDRSTTFVRLAREMAEADINPSDAFAVLRSCDERWGKHFLDRGPAGEAIVQRILAKAYR
jgi:hypothetical protein